MNALAQRITDLIREVVIFTKSWRIKRAIVRGNFAQAHRLWPSFKASILARSPQQCERMARARGLGHGR